MPQCNAALLQAQSQLASYSFADCVQTLLGETLEVRDWSHSSCYVTLLAVVLLGNQPGTYRMQCT